MLKRLLISLAIVGLLAAPAFAADYEFTVVPDEEGTVKADNVIITKKEIQASYAESLAQIRERYMAAKEQRDIAVAAMQRERALYLELKAELLAAIAANTVTPDEPISADPQ